MELPCEIEGEVSIPNAQPTPEYMAVVGKIVVKSGLLGSRAGLKIVTEPRFNHPVFLLPMHLESYFGNKCVVKVWLWLLRVAFGNGRVLNRIPELGPAPVSESGRD